MKRFQNLSRNAQLAVVGGALFVLFMLPITAFAIDEIRANGEVARNVQAATVDLGGLGRDDALTALRTYETELGATPLTFRVADQSFELLPAELGLDIDEVAIVDAAMLQRREKGFFGRFGSWFGSFGDMRHIDVPVTLELDGLDGYLETWEQEAINNPAHQGGLIVTQGRVLPDYPQAGEGVDRGAARGATLAAVQTLERRIIDLETRQLEPVLTIDDVDAAVERANLLIDGPITLRAADPEIEVEFPATVLAQALVHEVHTTDPPRIDLAFDRNRIGRVVTPLREMIEQPPRDAAFEIDEEDQVTLVPSRSQTLLDVALVVDRLFDVADRGGSSGTFPFAEGTQAEFTTEMAEAMGEITMVSSFTTEHSCCQDRVTNIQIMADAVDGAIVWPGEEFSLNGHVGERTVEKGYVPAPMILRGEIVDDVGGGVSQFATTLYNAVFFGCYEDVEHHPHSLYFSRYPEGREATVSWGGPELVFKNSTEAILIVKTAYTSRSITVKMFGNTGGRECTAGLGDRYRYTDPPIQFEPDETIPPGAQEEGESGTRGWTVDVFRYIRNADGTLETEVWSHRYQPRPDIVYVHPCDMEDAPDPCHLAVPDVLGRRPAGATTILENWGFVVTQETVPVEDEAQDGRVVGQNPAAGTAVDQGVTVTIQVGEFSGDEGEGGGEA